MTSHHDLKTKCAEGLQACKDEQAALQSRGTATNVVLGFAGAMLICSFEFDIPPGFFLRTALGSVNFKDYISGMYKTPFFGGIIAITGCHFGLVTRGGTEGVGQSTTRTVVAVSIAILIADFILTKVSVLVFPGR